MRRIRILVVICAALSMLAGVQLLSSAASAQDQTATHRVIVVFKQQAANLPATPALEVQRQSVFQSARSPVLAQLARSGAGSVHAYSVFNAVSATVSSSELSQLESNPAVSEVVADQVIRLASPQASGMPTAAPPTAPVPGACPAPGKVELDPQALQTMSVASQTPGARTARSLGLTGKGVKVAYIADGIDINNPDFIRADGQHVFVDYKDFSGQGTNVPTGGGEAFLDASSVAAQGRHVYDVSHFSDLPLNRPCDIRVEGVAPGASLVGLSIFGAENAAFNSQFLQAIDYAVTTDHVNVLNESLGSNYYPDDQASLDLIKRANDAAVAAGTTVAVSSGDAGVTSTIGTPATDPNVISTGATNTYRINAQTGYGGARFPGVSGWLDNDISSFSSGGFEQDGRTVDLAAPGFDNWALCSTDVAMYSDCMDFAGQPAPVQQTGGTSESAPLTAGEAALVIEAYRLKHRGATPSPGLIKQLIVSNTDDISAPANQQGAGLADAYKAVRAAEAYGAVRGRRGAGAKSTGALLASRTQLNAVDAPGTRVGFPETLTNESGSTQRLSLSTRRIGPYQALRSATVTLSDGSSAKKTDWQGITTNDQQLHFTVPRDEKRLYASIAFQNRSATDLAARVRLTLIDSRGRLAAYSVPQGDGNYGNVQVANPAPGTWSAYIYSRDTADGGTTGPVLFGAQAARYTRFGIVSPSKLTLAPGRSATVTLNVSTRSRPGDSAGAIVVRSALGGGAPASQTTIPVTLRSLIGAGSSSFTSALTGGNGRSPATGQTFYYQLKLNKPQPELNASVKLGDNPDNVFSAWLVSPSGQATAFASNTIPDANGNPQNQLGAELHTLHAAAGTWTLIVAFVPQVSGTALNEPFTVTTNQTPLSASGGGLPRSPSAQLTSGGTYAYNVTIKNTGPAPESFFPDARLPQSTHLPLMALKGASTTEPLTSKANIPVYLIPTETSALNEAARALGSQPIQFDSGSPAGDPDIASTVGSSVTASLLGAPITQGLWNIAPVNVGAFGPNPAPPEAVDTSAVLLTRAFDSTVSSPTGDLWSASADPSTLATFSPVTVNPGQTATIPITIKPTGAPGTKVSGTLFVDDANFVLFDNFVNPNGNEVAAIPYSYTIK